MSSLEALATQVQGLACPPEASSKVCRAGINISSIRLAKPKNWRFITGQHSKKAESQLAKRTSLTSLTPRANATTTLVTVNPAMHNPVPYTSAFAARAPAPRLEFGILAREKYATADKYRKQTPTRSRQHQPTPFAIPRAQYNAGIDRARGGLRAPCTSCFRRVKLIERLFETEIRTYPQNAQRGTG